MAFQSLTWSAYGLLWLWAGLSSLLIVSSQSENVSWCRRPFHPLITQRNTPAHQYWNVTCSLFREVIKVEKKESVENSTLSFLTSRLLNFVVILTRISNDWMVRWLVLNQNKMRWLNSIKQVLSPSDQPCSLHTINISVERSTLPMWNCCMMDTF